MMDTLNYSTDAFRKPFWPQSKLKMETKQVASRGATDGN